ncbi:MAG: DUF6941 family protein [Anaerolineae bacterium]|uniref:DUF6941 family protein n=1 Tax=Thermogutta sp. TaxID=1962930 RepID=UPI00321FDE70
MNEEPKLIAAIVCEDVLANPSGRLTLHNIFQDLTASGFPAAIERLHVVTVWHNPNEQEEHTVLQVAIVSADGTPIGIAAVSFTIAPGAYHTQISRFQGLVLPGPGKYQVQVQRGSQMVCDLSLMVTSTMMQEGV